MTEQPKPPQDIQPISIEVEMQRSYLGYAMSVIVSRALPDARDGLKPVHRRILYSMHENGYLSDKAYRKSARVVGDVMGKYHPHGDQSIYDAMVRMAQPFSMSQLLLDGQGNFGSMDGDKAAAMRYTEIRLEKAAEALLTDIDKDTIDFQPNYDDSTQEPTVLPAQYPNLLVNGANGIAVGMATNIPPHNMGEVIDACCAYVDNTDVTLEQLLEILPAPDFPTGGIILGRAGAKSAMWTGRGSVIVRGKVHFEEIRKDREAIIITEIPYQVNKSSMIEKMAELVRAKKIEGISDLRDESDRDGVRVVVEIKRDAMADVVLNQLYRFTPLQSSFGVNMLALNGGKPELLNIKQLIAAFVNFREEVILRRTRFLLGKARDRAHVLVGLAIAVANIDEVIKTIRAAPDPQTARDQLMTREWPAADVADMIGLIDDLSHKVIDGKYKLSETQARAILDLRLQRLTALGRDEIGDEMKKLAAEINEYLSVLGSRDKLMGILRSELVSMRERFAIPRRTQIAEMEFEQDDEDLIQREDMVVTVSFGGYVKRTPLSTYRLQKRGGKGRTGMSTKEEDFVTRVLVASTHTPVLFFSNIGRVYKLKVYRLPEGTPQSRGKAFVNLLPLADGEKITEVLPLPEDEAKWGELHVMFATAKGYVRRNDLSDFVSINANGKIAMKFEGEDADDSLVGVFPCTEQDDILLASYAGKCVRFPVADVRTFQSRSSTGVRGMKLAEGDRVISMSVLRHIEVSPEEREAYFKYEDAQERIRNGEAAVQLPADISVDRFTELQAAEQFILTVTEKGYGKRSSAYEYRITSRGGSGIINIETTAKNGNVSAAFPVEHDDQIMLVTDGGQVIRCPVHDIRIAGRNTQGVIIFKLGDGEKVASVAHLPESGPNEAGQDDGAGDSSGEEGGAPGDSPGDTPE
ncbi:MAG: DNA gyrase subunit A [Ferrovibrio sp.]|uniref:DNA gyrase subunit A n=1 Tax=Ferrovibrio sp. TaxID=1917215 RepID=UPI002618074E|nr:DNA gyrase subunit A [Ferrovibrio sp.]MCW0232198.1 DNA gyrase subunit A [Ferrovibrio sp.]